MAARAAWPPTPDHQVACCRLSAAGGATAAAVATAAAAAPAAASKQAAAAAAVSTAPCSGHCGVLYVTCYVILPSECCCSVTETRPQKLVCKIPAAPGLPMQPHRLDWAWCLQEMQFAPCTHHAKVS